MMLIAPSLNIPYVGAITIPAEFGGCIKQRNEPAYDLPAPRPATKSLYGWLLSRNVRWGNVQLEWVSVVVGAGANVDDVVR